MVRLVTLVDDNVMIMVLMAMVNALTVMMAVMMIMTVIR